MTVTREETEENICLKIEGSLSIYEANELRNELLASLESGTSLRVELSQVMDCDAAGLQLLVATRKSEKESRKKESATELALYDLNTDPAEIHDVADKHPDIVAALKPLLPPVAPYAKRKK